MGGDYCFILYDCVPGWLSQRLVTLPIGQTSQEPEGRGGEPVDGSRADAGPRAEYRWHEVDVEEEADTLSVSQHKRWNTNPGVTSGVQDHRGQSHIDKSEKWGVPLSREKSGFSESCFLICFPRNGGIAGAPEGVSWVWLFIHVPLDSQKGAVIKKKKKCALILWLIFLVIKLEKQSTDFLWDYG